VIQNEGHIGNTTSRLFSFWGLKKETAFDILSLLSETNFGFIQLQITPNLARFPFY
jgi:hypothetical protein